MNEILKIWVIVLIIKILIKILITVYHYNSIGIGYVGTSKFLVVKIGDHVSDSLDTTLELANNDRTVGEKGVT